MSTVTDIQLPFSSSEIDGFHDYIYFIWDTDITDIPTRHVLTSAPHWPP
jgi:hypothetical protein